MKREEWIEFLKTKVENKNIIKHMLATEVVMRALSRRLDPECERFWALAGLLHDGDYCKEVPEELQGIQISKWIEEEKQIKLPREVRSAMAAHNAATRVKPETKMEWGLFCADSLTGLIVASALVLPSKKLGDLNVDFVLKRFNEKSFAKGTRREDIKMCEKNLGISLPEFVKMSLQAMKDIAESLEL